MAEDKVVFITSGLPDTGHGGGAVTAYSILLSLKRGGFSPLIVSWPGKNTADDDRITRFLNDQGIGAHLLPRLAPSEAFSCFGFGKDLVKYYSAAGHLNKFLYGIKACALVIYHWEGLIAASTFNDLPKLGLVGDPVHLPALLRCEFQRKFAKAGFKNSVKDFLVRLSFPLQMAEMRRLLNSCRACGAFAGHHAQMLRDSGVKKCRYFRTPVTDPFADGKPDRKPGAKPKILLLGHLKGIATLSGMVFFSQEVFPRLLSELGDDGFEVHIVGDDFAALPDNLKKQLLHPSIKVRGRVSPIDAEFLDSHLLLVPAPIELGIRVRIISAFSYGTPVVAHIANKKGIPELAHQENALLASSGEAIAKEIVRLIKDTQLQQKLSEAGRKTYQRFFSLDTAGKEITDVLKAF